MLWVAANTGLVLPYFKYPEITQFHRASGGDLIRQTVQQFLHYNSHVLLNKAGRFGYLFHKITLGH